MTTFAFNNRRYWSARKVGEDRYVRTTLRCSECGYRAPHYLADYNARLRVFTVPHAGLNGGIGEELGAEYWTERTRDVDNIMLSKCCDAPSAGSLRRLTRPGRGGTHG